VPWHRPGRARRTLPRRRLGVPARMLLSSILRSGRSARHDQPDLLRRRQESPGERRHTPPVQVANGCRKERPSWSGAPSSPWHVASAGHAAAPPGAGARSGLANRDTILLRCCILLLYKARELGDQDFEFISLTWGGATGIRTPDLLHAISRQHVHPCLSSQVTVPERAHQSGQVRTGCCTFALYRSARPTRPPNERLTSQNLQKLYRGASRGSQHPIVLHEMAMCRRQSGLGRDLPPLPRCRRPEIRTTGHRRARGHRCRCR
jgi:hypothetical protein